MPFYRLKTGIVHMKGTKLPEPCAARILVDGKEAPCLAPSSYLCDGRDDRHRSGTCDAPLCPAHAREIGANRHLCPACHLSHTDSQAQRSLFTSLVAARPDEAGGTSHLFQRASMFVRSSETGALFLFKLSNKDSTRLLCGAVAS